MLHPRLHYGLHVSLAGDSIHCENGNLATWRRYRPSLLEGMWEGLAVVRSCRPAILDWRSGEDILRGIDLWINRSPPRLSSRLPSMGHRLSCPLQVTESGRSRLSSFCSWRHNEDNIEHWSWSLSDPESTVRVTLRTWIAMTWWRGEHNKNNLENLDREDSVTWITQWGLPWELGSRWLDDVESILRITLRTRISKTWWPVEHIEDNLQNMDREELVTWRAHWG